MERSADSHIAIKGHNSQKQTFCASHYVKDVKLNNTSNVTNGLSRASKIKQDVRQNACGVAHVQIVEICEEELHGAVKTGF